MKVAVTISPRDYDVVLFDLDGMLTGPRACMRQPDNTTGVFCLNSDATHRGDAP